MNESQSTQAAELRRRAEDRLKEQWAGAVPPPEEVDVHRLVYELQVQQMALELQSEELRQARAEIEAERESRAALNVERARVEAALNEQISALHSIIGSANALVFSVDRDYCYTSYNKAHAVIMNAVYSAKIEIGHSLLGYITVTEDREIAKANLDRALAGEEVVREAYVGEKSRSRRYFHISHAPIRTDTGTITGAVMWAQDLTEQKRAEEALQESEARYRALFEESIDGVFVTSPAGKILDISRAGIAMFGYDTKDELLRLDLATEIYAEPGDREQVLSVVRERGSAEYEVRVKRKNGEVLLTRCFNTAVRDDDGKIIGYRGVIRDITQTRRAEEELRRSEWRKVILDRITNVFLFVADEKMYGEVLTIVLEAMESKFGLFGYIADNGDLVMPSLTREIWSECQVPDKSIVFPPATWGASLWGRAIREKKAFYSDGPFHIPVGHIRIDCFLTTPIVFGGNTIGVFSVANRERGYTAEDSDLLESIADYISPILNARLQRDRQERERKRGEEALQHANQLLETIFDHTHIMAAYLDAQFNFIRVNRAYALVDEREPSFFPGKNHFELYPNTENETIFRRVVETGEPHFASAKPFEYAEHLERGVSYWDWSLVPIKDISNTVTGLVLTLLNVTERKWAEARILHLTRLYATLSQVNQMVVRARQPEELYEKICNIAVDIGQFRLAWIGVINENSGKLNVVARAGDEEEYRQRVGNNVKSRFDDVTDSALRTGKVVTHQEVLGGHDAFAAIPFGVNGKIVGVLNLCASETAFSDPEELMLLDEISADISFALNTMAVERERKRTEKALASERALLRMVIDNVPDYIWLKDTTSHFVLGNIAVARSFGKADPSELVGLCDFDYHAPELAQRFYAEEQELIRTGQPLINYERYVTEPDGRTKWLNSTKIPLRDQSGNIIGIIGISRDMTEHRRAQEQVAKLAAIVQFSDDAIIGKTPDGIITSWNRGAERIYGYAESEVIGKSISILVPPGREDEVLQILARIRRGEHVEHLETVRRRKDGQDIFVSLMVSPVQNAEGQIVAASTIGRDVTARKQAAEGLRRTNRALRAISDSHQVLAHATTESTLLNEICGVIVETAGYRMAWIGFAEHDEQKTVRPVASAGFEEGYVEKAHVSWADDERGRGPGGTTIRTGRPVVCRDIMTDTNFAPWRAEAATRGFASLVALPLVMDGRVYGALGIYASETDAFDTEEVRLLEELAHDVTFGLQALRARGERRRAEETRLAHLRFLESLDRVNRAIQETNDLDQMMRDVLDAVLSIFGCDRAWLIYPCDPESVVWQTRMERSRPEYPGVLPMGVELPLEPAGAAAFRLLRAANGPVKFAPGSEHQVPTEIAHGLGVQSLIAVALYPKVGLPWSLGLHQCSYPRVWTPEEERLFQEIGRRLTDALTSMLAHSSLQAASAYNRSLIETALDPLVTIGPDGKITDVNRATELVTGVSRRELVGSDFSDYFTEPAKARAGYQEVFRTGSVRDYPLEIQHREGHVTPVLYNASVYRDEKAEIVGVFAAARDITERKQAEAHLNETLIELARSNADLEQFAYAASHDLQEPLRMVVSYLQLLTQRYQGQLDADADEFIGYAVEGATRMHKLINDLLSYSRVGTRGEPFEPTDCEEVLSEVLADLRVSLEATGGVVTHDSLPVVMADDGQLIHVFQNLIGNAIKFRGAEPPRIHISACRTSGSPETPEVWTFSVRDNGIGISPEYFKRIFMLFQRLHTRAEYPGSGIGLAVCKKIVERHRGHIWVESQLEQGSTFYFTIPA